jgi:hypothetical protein
MNVLDVLLGGFLATAAVAMALATAQGLGYSRVSFPLILGTMVTSDRNLAMPIGTAMHMVIGIIFAFLYAAIFDEVGSATVWFGVLLGIGHALFMLLIVLPLLPGLHPRMASELQGPTPTRQLQPPGFLALHYGRGTPLVTIMAHVLYGGLLGHFYHVPG